MRVPCTCNKVHIGSTKDIREKNDVLRTMHVLRIRHRYPVLRNG